MGFLSFIRCAAARASLLAATGGIDPIRIATNAEKDGKITITGEEQHGFLGLFAFDYLYSFLKREVLIWGAILTVFLLVSMLFITRSEKLAERKADILHKLLIVLLASSTLTLLSALVNLLDWIF